MNCNSNAEKLLFSTVKIRGEGTKPENGSHFISEGTGFFYYVKRENKIYPFLITNRHVIENCHEGIIRFSLNENGQPSNTNYELTINNFSSLWYLPQNPETDIAVAPLKFILEKVKNDTGKDPFICPIHSDIALTSSIADTLDAIEDITFIGYPNGLWDDIHNLPIIRKGISATPIAVDFKNLPVFLVDASVFPGSSGSPVFILNSGSFPSKTGELMIGDRIIFLGILSRVYNKTKTGSLELVNTALSPIITIQEEIDIGIVYKASLIDLVIDEYIAAKSN